MHKGVDIFATTGTPVVAISDGFVARVDQTVVGGKVIWVRDAKRNQAYYYAHLDEFLTEEFVRDVTRTHSPSRLVSAAMAGGCDARSWINGRGSTADRVA